MSTDKEKLNNLLAKVDELAITLNKVSEELRSVSASMRSLAVGQITQPLPTSTAAQRTSAIHAPIYRL